MRRYKVIISFYDLIMERTFKQGTIVELVDSQRVEEMVAIGYLKCLDKKEPVKKVINDVF